MSIHKVNARGLGRDRQVYDVIGIGFGPANIVLEELGQATISEQNSDMDTWLFINEVSHVD
ncbi:MAG: hypothetical protein A3J25_08900 [Pseudomonadales bacterium RIFCSPLOWO2_02_FULL_63_210]|nr:MAG: hypothetical protein A3J25_08900 [Pseudomonadales bacterium RIFCSPLOWO2_02_FULL_63_210]